MRFRLRLKSYLTGQAPAFCVSRPKGIVYVRMKSHKKKIRISSLTEMDIFAENFLRDPQKEKGRATVVGLKGDLGSGKTAFVKAVGKKLGIKERISSPTFVLERVYRLPKQKGAEKWTRLIHIDAYRLENNVREISSLGWKQIIADEDNIILIEWPEKIKSFLPKDARTLSFKFIDETKREIHY